MKLRSLLYIALASAVSLGVVSCNDDDLDPVSIFPDVDDKLDPTSYSFQLDSFLKRDYLTPYNLDFKYKMEDIGTDMDYNLVPARYGASVDLAVLTKYLWFDTYDKVAGTEFLKTYGPRIIHLIGSPAFNPSSGTMILGLAEGGIKVSLYRVNYIDPSDAASLNEYYFHTMHHEFAHILHQTRNYPTEYDLLSVSFYDPTGWQSRDDRVCNSFGCVTAYGSSEDREDFAEVVSTYITSTDEEWDSIMYYAGRNFVQVGNDNYGNPTYDDPESAQDDEGGLADGADGVAILNQKLSIIQSWFRDSWGFEIDSIRAEVQRRQKELPLDSLRNMVYTIEIPAADVATAE